MANSLSLVWDLIAVDNASATFGRVGAAADSTTGSVKRLVEGFGLLAVGGAIVESAKQAAEFQKQMLLVQTQAGATSQEVRNMTPAILSLAGQVAQAPEQLATSLYHVESTGLRGKAALDAVRVAAEGAKVGNADLEQTTNALTATIASGMLPATETYSQAMGQLNTIVGSGDMKMQDLNDALSTGLLVTVKQYGVNLNDVGAALADFGDNNLRGSDAATRLRMAVQAIAAPGKAAGMELGRIGLTTKELATTMEQHGLNAALIELHDHLVKSGIDASQWGDLLTQAFTKKAGGGILTLIGTFDRFEQKYQEVSKGADSFGGAWQATTKTASFQFSQLKDTVDALGISLGSKLLPVAGDFASWLSQTGIPDLERFGAGLGNVWHQFTQLPGPVQDLAYALVALRLADHIGLLNRFSSSAGSVTTAIRTMGQEMSTAFNQARAAQIDTLFQSTRTFAVSGLGEVTAQSALAESAVGRMSGNIAGFGAALGRAAEGGVAALKSGVSGLVGLFGGPWGVAIAGAVAVVPSLVHWLTETNNVIPKVTVNTQSLTAAIQANSGAIDTNVRKQAAQALQQAGLFKAAQQWGVSVQELTDATLGNSQAIADVSAKAEAYKQRMDAAAASTSNGSYQSGIAADAYEKAAMQSNSWLQSLQNTTGIVANTINQQKQLSQAVYGTANTVDGLKGAIQQMGLTSQTTWADNVATVNGATAAQIQDLENLGVKVKTLPNGNITVTADPTPAENTINGLLRQYQNVQYTGSAIIVNGRVLAKADGGPIVGPGTGTSDSIPAMLSNGEHVWTAAEVQSAGGHAAVARMRKAALGQVKAFAAGGPVGWNITDQFPVQPSQAMLDSVRSMAQAAMSYNASAGVEQWRSTVAQVVGMLGLPMAAINGILNIIQHESGGNPRAINLTDSNARAGHPSQGLMQTIPSTFYAWAGPFASRGILDPLANIYAGTNYALHTYGPGMLAGGGRSIGGHYVGYRDGTNWVPADQFAYLHRGEAVVPASKNQGAPYQSTRPAPLIHVENMHVNDQVDLDLALRQAEFRQRAGAFS